MPESRTCTTTETPCSPDDLPPPCLILDEVVIKQVLQGSSEKPVLTKTAAKTNTTVTKRDTATQTEALQTGTVVDSSKLVDNSRKVDNSKAADKSRSVDKTKIESELRAAWTKNIAVNPAALKTHKANTEVPKMLLKTGYPVAVSENDEKPTIVTSRRPFDSSCSGSLYSQRHAADVISRAESRPADVPATPVSSDRTQASATVTSSSNSKSNSPTLTRNTASLPPRSQSSSISTSSSSINPQTPSTKPSTSYESASNSTSESSGSERTGSSSMAGNKNSSGKKAQRKRAKRKKSETRWSEDVDNYMGNKSIDELVRFIGKI